MIKQIQEKTLGLIWITDEVLSRSLKDFDELNYLSSDLIVKSNQGYHKEVNFFLTSSYGKPFFVAHLKKTDKLKNNALNILDITKNISEPGQEVLVISEDQKLLQFLKKERQDLGFQLMDRP